MFLPPDRGVEGLECLTDRYQQTFSAVRAWCQQRRVGPGLVQDILDECIATNRHERVRHEEVDNRNRPVRAELGVELRIGIFAPCSTTVPPAWVLRRVASERPIA